MGTRVLDFLDLDLFFFFEERLRVVMYERVLD